MSADDIKTIQEAFTGLTHSDAPFMTLFFLIMMFVIYMGIRVMRYVNNVSENHQGQLAQMNDHMKAQREDHLKQVVEERFRSDRREKDLFVNLEKNTTQLEGIATTLKEVQFNFTSLEHKVVQNFNYLETEIENLKENIRSSGS